MKKLIRVHTIIIVLISLIIFPKILPVYAQDTSIIDNEVESKDKSNVEKIVKKDQFKQVEIQKAIIDTIQSETLNKELPSQQIDSVATVDNKAVLNTEDVTKEDVVEKPMPKNLIVICVEGLSRNTLYKLLNKNKLPNFQAVMKKGNNNGNYRNLELANIPSEPIQTYQQLLTGQYEWLLTTENRSETLPKGVTIFDHMKKAFPQMSVAAVLSAIQSNKTAVTFETMLANATPSLDYKTAVLPRTSKGVTVEVLTFLKKTKSQFFLFTNFTDVDVMGHHYREGAQRYSDAVKDCDKAIGEIIATLKSENRWDQTEFLITTNYGFNTRSQSHTDQIKSWILSSFKIRYKGTLQDVVPTILRYFKIDQSDISPPLPGQKLIY